VVEFIFKIVDSLFKVLSLGIITLETGSANILNCVTEVIIKFLVTDEIPYFYRTSRVVGG
jgi:hypothetical protein